MKDSQQAIVPKWEWVEVANPDGIGRLGFGDACGIREGGTVTKVVEKYDMVLVRYHNDRHEGGTGCPNGTLFLMRAERFSHFTAHWKRLVAEREAKRKMIKDMLEQSDED